ncbi:2OG-Fe(II) oxygenase [Nocardia asiatica]|uniref:2OG-Fe(II) oxygenase n=1 Tax=Nocardia asiatica TaxID=209252 RepID=UPI003CC7F008
MILDPRRSMRVHDHPFRHVVYENFALIPESDVAHLVQTFPSGLLSARRSRPGGDKSYAVRTATLYDMQGPSPHLSELPQCWRDLVAAVVDPAYGDAMASILGLETPSSGWEVRLSEYTSGAGMSRHTDRAHKLFSQNIYLCPEWQTAWGGGLALYDGPDTPEPAVHFLPGPGVSVAFARSDDSWHEVLPVSSSCPLPRRALLVHGYRDQEGHSVC